MLQNNPISNKCFALLIFLFVSKCSSISTKNCKQPSCF